AAKEPRAGQKIFQTRENPLCSVSEIYYCRVNSIESHYSLNHPGKVFNQRELGAIPFALETKGKSNPGFGHRRPGAWPLSGGLPSLGRKK
ncbi:hypothetical protein, partial [Microbulbifer taiwanensis]|uniref:hypothetical protein n=2 Tax=Microbulbifer taiwanensis TaxID=986746 RepID=UPI003612E62B